MNWNSEKITEILVGKQLAQLAEFLGAMLHALAMELISSADTPIEFLYLRARIQVDDAMTEKVECLFAYLLCIVPGFQHAALTQVVPDVIQFLHQFVGILSRFPVVIHFGQEAVSSTSKISTE
mgnify:CR=1 FL=1